ncbi:MAG: fumarate hydratase [Candidatus Omnitrophota bacterium]
MREIKVDKIREAAADLAKEANFVLRADVLKALKSALARETDRRSGKILKAIINNAEIAKKEKLAICQDTGLPVVFGDIGQEARVTGGSLAGAIHQGLALGYAQGSLRRSIVKDPLSRGSSGFSPAIIHTEIVPGDKIKLSLLPKGFGCENKSQIRMFKPTASIEEIKRFILETVAKAGPDACPPFVLGIGIGGTQDYAAYLAKKALLNKVKSQKSKVKNTNQKIYKLEKELLNEINNLNIGPMGLGGKTTCLGVNILSYPTHIAGLPVAVNISCHALRSAVKII